jgi:hypothetical protein
MHRHPTITKICLFIIATIVLGFFVFGTSPERVGPFGITLFFGVVLVAAALGIELLSLLIIGKSIPLGWRLSAALLLTSFLALSTVSVGAGDVVLIAVLFVAMVLYWSRISRN